MQGVQLQTDLLKNIPIFRSLSDDLLQAILTAPENGIEEYEPKKLIIRESEIGDCMYIILEGVVEVLIRAESSNREIAIASLRAGDFFGERSLMPGSTGRRNASIKSMYATRVFRIDRKYVDLSIKRDDFTIEDDEDVTAINITGATPKKKAPPKEESFEPDDVRSMLMNMRLFKSLSRDELMSIKDWTEIISAGPGDFVLKEAQQADAMYVIMDGTVDIFTLDNDGKIVVLARLEKGEYFGEQALMPDSKGRRNAFARSDKEARLIKIPKEYFRLVLNRDSDLARELQKKHESNKQALKNVRQT
ncbi:MAG TPA: cyclic nucleotide-binding domain-containing protein [Gammaproteobacteria bacterium]|nr:cyclic nucleotide-binding domain-containing protein [Gammaproteobacteria bacterium]